MKFAYATAALAFAGVAAAETCTSSQQSSAYATLAGLLVLDAFQGCTDDSGFSLLFSTTLPSDAQYTQMCASINCQDLIAAILPLNPPDCTLTVPTSGLKVNVLELASGFSAKCDSLNPTTAPVTTAPPPTTTAPATTAPVTEAPVTEAPVTEAPVTETPVTEAPSTTTPATTAPVTDAPTFPPAAC
jgi:hypothetical protein